MLHPSEPFQLAVIVGSVREGRYASRVADWFLGQVERRDDVKLDLIDLADTPVPVVQLARPRPEVRALAERVGAADAFVVITPEYNHSFPGPLKVAIDAVHSQWAAKPVGFVSYGGISAGLRAVEHLRAVFAELHAVTVRDTVSFYLAEEPLDPLGRLREPAAAEAAAALLLDRLAWWAGALRDARAKRPYAS